MFTVDRFLGLNEAPDGDTELKMGQAARMENFFISDGCNLVSRNGVQRIDREEERGGAQLLAVWSGNVGGDDLLIAVDFSTTDRIWLYTAEADGGIAFLKKQEGALGLTEAEGAKVKIFAFGGKLFIMSAAKTVVWEAGSFTDASVYVPLVITGANPAGGGTALENFNLLSRLRRIDFSADGAATNFVLPAEAVGVTSVKIDNQEIALETAGSFDDLTHSFNFNNAPAKGVGNVEFTYTTDAEEAERNRLRVVNMRLTENYNGQTDTRIFMAGDGSNICIYSGVPMSGDLSQLYFPAMNEVSVDMAAGAVTGLVRSDNKLLVFTKAGADLIVYEPVTLADGSTIGGFYLRTANREFGNEVMGQVQVVRNKVRSVTKGGIYEWNFGSYYTRDERHAKRVSDPVTKSFQRAEPERVVTCDDNYGQTYYAFLNDGSVLVNRYALEGDIWCLYKSDLFYGVRWAVMVGKTMVFATDTDIFFFASWATMDAPREMGGENRPIGAVWESGYMDFGADFRRKYSSTIYISMLPQSRSALAVTAKTDKRESYMEKVIGSNVFSFANASFAQWSFDMNRTPKMKRVRLKVKKFVYYKLIFKVEEPGSRATVLSFDQEVRFSSKVK
jgi:hypothetical protein